MRNFARIKLVIAARGISAEKLGVEPGQRFYSQDGIVVIL